MPKGVQTTKISVKVYRPVIDYLNKQLNAACLRRDAYLNFLLGLELERLDDEVSVSNSEESEKLVASRLSRLDTKLVSLALDAKHVEQLADICARKRIVRDAFFNRLFLLLVAPPEAIDTFFFREIDGEDWRSAVWDRVANDNDIKRVFFDPLRVGLNPFWIVRQGLDQGAFGGEYFLEFDDEWSPSEEERSQLPGDGVYTRYFSDEIGPVDLTGMNCYVPPELVARANAKNRPARPFASIMLGDRRRA